MKQKSFFLPLLVLCSVQMPPLMPMTFWTSSSAAAEQPAPFHWGSLLPAASLLVPLALIACTQLNNKKKSLPQTVKKPIPIGSLTFSGYISSTDKFHDALQRCLDDDSIQGIIIKIDAEWGVLSICSVMFHELKRAAQQKPLIALIEKNCCREPYLIATAADCIIANDYATIGMIGTSYSFAEQRPDPTKEIVSFYAGKHTPLGDAHHHITPQEQQMIATQLERQYQQLCETIAEQRDLDLLDCALWAEGRPFLGKQAHALHLVDRIGTLSDAYEVMAELLTTRCITSDSQAPQFTLVHFTL